MSPQELDREEWWEVAHYLRPSLKREDFNARWEAFQKLKAERVARKASLRVIEGGKT